MNKPMLGILLGALLALVGCGGGGGSAAVAPGGASVSTYATDSLNDDYSQVWVTIHRVSLEGGSGTLTVFDDPAGRLVDLKTLRDASGARYAFLDDSSVTPATYGSVAVQLDEDLSLVPNGSASAEARKFATQYADPLAPGKSILRLGSAHEMRPGRNTLVLDFDLATWDLDGTGRVVASVKNGNGAGLDDRRRHEHEDFKGVVSNLAGTAPNQTFTLSRRLRGLSVKTDSNTRIFNSSGAPNPQLADGARVEVRGVFVAGALLAAAIKVEDEAGEDPIHIVGHASNLNEGAGTFDVAIRRARGFVPRRVKIPVSTSDTTRFLSDAGATMTKAEFFAAVGALGQQAIVEVEGALSGDSLTASKVKIEAEGVHSEAEAKGAVTAVDPTAGTLTITVQSWEGINIQPGSPLNVATGPATMYMNGRTMVDKATFFAAVSAGSVIEARGRWDGSKLAALRLKLDD